MLNRLVGDLIENTRARIAKAGVKTLDDVRRNPERLARFSDEVERERAEAKQFLYDRLYFSEPLLPEKERAEEVVSQLFAFWVANPDKLPRSYQEDVKREPLPRVICDYIAGMTDTYILAQHKKFCGAKRSPESPKTPE